MLLIPIVSLQALAAYSGLSALGLFPRDVL